MDTNMRFLLVLLILFNPINNNLLELVGLFSAKKKKKNMAGFQGGTNTFFRTKILLATKKNE